MSITFACPDAPRSMRPCQYCAWTREDWQRSVNTYIPSADSLPPPSTPPKCEPWCTGERLESDAPECNFGNGNAYNLLVMLHLPEREYGTIKKPSEVLREVIRLVNVAAKRAPYTHEGADEGGVTTCRIITAPNPDSAIRRRLEALQAVLVYAADHGYSVSWG